MFRVTVMVSLLNHQPNYGHFQRELPPPHDRHGYIGPCPCMTVDEASSGVFHLNGIFAKMFLDISLKLPQGKDCLHQSGSAYRMPTCQKAAGWIHRNFFPFESDAAF